MIGFEEWRKLGRDVRDTLRASEDFLVARSRTMSDELRNVWRAFSWVLSYYREIIKLCDRVRAEFEGHPLGYEDWTGSKIEYANSKAFSKVSSWLPLYHYQFFGRSTAEEDPANSMLAVSIEHYDPEGVTGHEEPYIFLARFSHPPTMSKRDATTSSTDGEATGRKTSKVAGGAETSRKCSIRTVRSPPFDSVAR